MTSAGGWVWVYVQGAGFRPWSITLPTYAGSSAGCLEVQVSTPPMTDPGLEQRAEEITGRWVDSCDDPTLVTIKDWVRLDKAIASALRAERERTIEECAKVADAYAERNRRGEECGDQGMRWCSVYHRIAGENIRDEIRALASKEGSK